jgi:tetratricopeptide (TPR) repeat protein
VLHALASLISGLERFDGRKTLLLLTDGFVADQSWPLVEQAVGLAARANARIYTLDARGLDRFPQPASNYAPHDDGLGHLLGSLDVAADAMNSLAVDTGGFAVRNVNMFDKAIAQITDEASTYYVLGYRPDTLPDGKFHHITVRVKRPAVAVRARRGYVATIRPDPRLTAATEVPAARPLESSSLTAPVSVLPSAVDPRSLAPAAQPDASATGAANPAMPTAAEGSGSRIRLRPDAVKHVESLASATRADAAAASGWEAYERGDLESARAALSVAAAQPASPAWVHYALGQAEYALGDWAGAVREWDHVRDAAPGFEPVYFDLVDGFLQQKEYDRAVRLLRSAAARWPHDPDVFDALGVVQVTRGALDDAIGSFQRAIAAAPEQSVAYFNLAKTYELRYIKSRRYVQATRSWAANEADRRNATAAYNKYLELGGPLASSAREGLARLEWQVSR